MTRFVALASVLLLALSVSAFGQIQILDPLHGCIIGTNCHDNGTVTPTTTNPLPNFTFTVSPGPQTGDLLVDILVPNTPGSGSLSFAVDGVNATLKGDWTSGDLDTFLSINASPTNPLNAWLGYTNGNNCGSTQNQTCNPAATGFEVYQADLGTQTLEDPGFNGGFPTGPVLSLTGSALPTASVLTGFLSSGASYIATASSGGIFEADAPPTSTTPEPFSITLLSTVCLLVGNAYRKKTRRN